MAIWKWPVCQYLVVSNFECSDSECYTRAWYGIFQRIHSYNFNQIKWYLVVKMAIGTITKMPMQELQWATKQVHYFASQPDISL